MSRSIYRRRFVGACSAVVGLVAGFPRRAYAAQRPEYEAGYYEAGYVVGEPTAEVVGKQVLADGGNAVDAIVAAALTAAVAAPNQTGIGGYGMSAIISLKATDQIVAIDGNSAAPAAMQADVFQNISTGQETSRRNEVGWQAAGVPGVLAGLSLALRSFGTRELSELLQPAIRVARAGYPWPASLAQTLKSNPHLRSDPGSRRLYFPDGQPIAAGAVFKNSELAEVLETLAKANSVDPFYRGDIAQRIADGFQKNGGLVTSADLAAYTARMVTPLSMEWNEFRVHSPPLTAGGLTVIQVLECLKALQWSKLQVEEQLYARIEATRLAWSDRLALLGDSEFASVPIEKLLSKDYANECAQRIRGAMKQQTYLRHAVPSKPQSGTINLSSIDRWGNMAALTLTHGDAFGAKVTVDGLGLTLGHGMSRFDTRPDHPNAPGPKKRPLHNMVPTIVTRDDEAIMAVGGRGGRKIVNAVLEMVLQFIGNRQSLAASMAAPRFHTEGGNAIQFEPRWPESETQAMEKIGYVVSKQSSATLSGVAVEDGTLKAAMR